MRLLIDTQALGYLNLYRLTGQQGFMDEADDRLHYILQLGDSALARREFDGQLGYSLLYAHSLTGAPEYRQRGLELADLCAAGYDPVMNWGYLAALNMGEAYRLTGQSGFLAACRRVARRTASRQFSDGAFPHQADTLRGENTHYTSWLLFEMLLHRRQDPLDPDLDAGLLKGADFLARRVNPDGSLNYEDERGSYYSDVPGATDSRGWMNELPMVAFDLLATGRQPEARRVLDFLFRHEMDGADAGGYPDKWGFVDSTGAATAAEPSVVRTSLVFWFLTEIALMKDPRWNGMVRSCEITPGDCNVAFRELDQCDAGLPGIDVRIDGLRTGCLDPALIRFVRRSDCLSQVSDCTYLGPGIGSEFTTCWYEGTQKCVGPACTRACFDVVSEVPTSCETQAVPGDVCDPGRATDGTEPERVPAAPGSGDGDGPRFALHGVRPNPAAGDLDITFDLARPAPVRLELMDAAGRRVVSRALEGRAGRQVVRLDRTTSLPAGVYLVRLSQGRQVAVTRAVIVR